MASARIYDVLIIGAGPAGLSTALGLARQTYSAIVFNSNQYRNAFADRMHNVLTWDHKPPNDFRAAARDNIESRYSTIHFKNATITSAAAKEDGTFEVVDEQENKYQGRKLALATGVTDVLPDIKGFSELWGKNIFHCLFCHGFEERGAESAGVLGGGFISEPAMILHMARMASPLAKKVTVYCDGNEELAAQLHKEFEGKPLTIEPRKITAFGKRGESITVQFDSSQSRQESFQVSVPRVRINGPFHEQLGLDVDPMGFIKTNPPFNETNVPGCFAVGDCGSLMKSVPQALATGSFGAAGLVAQLGAEGEL
ncbi:NAD(P)/FAD-dependent oxidoreductase [Aspergillus foveolatus]|uniref:NAD(P)/FAD-dependent oxidoreductase n=1 Tax=Aspergillus foveolatus TaxID=210207 RepID=UPI003CCCC58F